MPALRGRVDKGRLSVSDYPYLKPGSYGTGSQSRPCHMRLLLACRGVTTSPLASRDRRMTIDSRRMLWIGAMIHGLAMLIRVRRQGKGNQVMSSITIEILKILIELKHARLFCDNRPRWSNRGNGNRRRRKKGGVPSQVMSAANSVA